MKMPPDLDTDTRSIIDAARGGHEPNEMARARVRKGLEIKLAAGVALAVGPTASAFAGALKVTAAVVAVGAVVTAGVYVAPRYLAKKQPARPTAAHVATHAAPVVTAPPAEIDVPAPAVAPAPRAHVKHRAPVAAPAPVPVENVSSSFGLKEETVLLGGANAALARGDVKRAQALLEDYDRRPGTGSALLAEERTVTGILTDCAAGRADAARAEARHFHARWPHSPLAARVDASCAGPAGSTRGGSDPR
jgi:hypothetical protein